MRSCSGLDQQREMKNGTRAGSNGMDSIRNQVCPNCGSSQLSVYYSDQTDDKLGAWCEGCDMKVYYCGEKSVLFN